ncbi:hypothetical protein BDA96_03G423200 [Sorghum bicolor]|uniref:Uncharacterized protein n=2 Tax=Sorghum bicolor TaxID=4558 RepID=A0A921RJ48_SORBI|nr:hypothetical protein BDA96_03G423200 [Sorghum bicolor]OQU88058.1 hypothetical protein SORBI_3003G392350 [Sorghum bicolor]
MARPIVAHKGLADAESFRVRRRRPRRELRRTVGILAERSSSPRAALRCCPRQELCCAVIAECRSVAVLAERPSLSTAPPSLLPSPACIISVFPTFCASSARVELDLGKLQTWLLFQELFPLSNFYGSLVQELARLCNL